MSGLKNWFGGECIVLSSNFSLYKMIVFGRSEHRLIHSFKPLLPSLLSVLFFVYSFIHIFIGVEPINYSAPQPQRFRFLSFLISVCESILVSQSTKEILEGAKEDFVIIVKALDLPKDDNYYTGLFQKFRTLTGVNLDIKKLTGYLSVKNGTNLIDPITLVRVSYPLEHASVVIKAISDFEKGPASKNGKAAKKVRIARALNFCLNSLERDIKL